VVWLDVISRSEVWVCRSTVISNVYIEVHCGGNCVKLIGSVSNACHNMVVCETGKYKVCSIGMFGRCRWNLSLLD
jgi:hypothetical protein